MSTSKQLLLNICKQLFQTKHQHHSPASIARLTTFLKDAAPTDFLEQDTFHRLNHSPKIVYYPIHDTTDPWIVGIFVLPPHAKIPIHDHPKMCVTSKLLFGNCHLTSYDWLTTALHSSTGNTPPRHVTHQYAELIDGAWMETNEVWSLFEDNGNLHAITAGEEGCALLDVISPDYDQERKCTYYKEEDSNGTCNTDAQSLKKNNVKNIQKLVPYDPNLIVECVQ
jgi:hypothetical protein